MAVTATSIITRVGRLLNDEANTRWTEAELLAWINEGIVAICMGIPTASVEERSIPLASGSAQEIPIDATAIVRVIYSIGDSDIGESNAAPMSIRMVDRHAMDVAFPAWRDPAVNTPAAHVEDVMYDPADPRRFDVSPPNDGTGGLRTLLAVLPAPLTAASQNIPLADEYANPLVDYAAFRAFSKDALVAGTAARAATHAQLFTAATGIKVEVETVANPNTTRQTQKP